MNYKILCCGIVAVAMVFLGGCGFLGLEGVLDSEIPDPWPVSINNSHYAASVAFTGNPDVDFGPSLAKGDTSDLDVIYNDGSIYRNIEKVYIGYNPQGLFLGAYTSAVGTEQNANGRLVFMIDNGITNGSGSNGLTNAGYIIPAGPFGPFTPNPSGASYALDGSKAAYGWDTCGVAVVGEAKLAGRKVSCWFQHWRPLGADMAFYTAYDSPLNKEKTGGGSFIRYPASGGAPTGVTQVFLPWQLVFGMTDMDAMPAEIYIAVRCDAGIAANITGVDVWPNDGGDEDPSLLSKSTEWYKVQIK